MRRAAFTALGFARQAAGGDLRSVNVDAWSACSSRRAAWLHSAAGAATAAGGGGGTTVAVAPLAAPHCLLPARGISASCRTQHTAQPAAEAATQQQQQQQRQGQPQQQRHERTCWQCGTVLAQADYFFCPQCDSVQPASEDPQYFEVFNIGEPRFDLEPFQLDQQYKALQRRLHPDKYSRASPLELEYAQQQAAVVNQAHDVLKRPLRRAHYILNLSGFGACEGMTITDPELLMYVMEAREEVDSINDPEKLRALHEQNAGLERKVIQGLVEAFGAGDLQRAAELTTQLRYICRIREAITEKL